MIANFFESVASNPYQFSAVVILVSVFLMAFIGVNRTGLFAKLAQAAPNILITIGIFFTFLGILIALNNFNVRDINTAIPKLLDGLKLAFLSSVIGLGLSVGFRTFRAFLTKQEKLEDVTAGDLLSELQSLNTNTLAVKEALVGDGESSLSTQFGKLRNDFRDFAEKMKEDGTQALVEALENVIRDFNTKITEQFGENFKQLNEAVGALLEWQKEYRLQVESLTLAFKETQTGITKIEESVSKIPDHMTTIETAFNNTQQRVEELYVGLASLAEMRESAKQAVPQIKESIDGMTSGLKESIEQQIKVIDSQLQSMKSAQDSANDDIKQMATAMKELMQTSLEQTTNSLSGQMEKFQGVLNSLNMGADNVLNSTEQVSNRVNEIIDGFSSKQEQVSREIQSKIDQSVADNVEAMNTSMKGLDEGMQRQLQRSLDAMGNNLTSITEKFVDIYESNAKQIIELTNSITQRTHNK